MGTKRYIKRVILLIILLLASLSLHIFYGIDLKNNPMDILILTQIRIPRALLGLIVGGGLALCGAALQGVFRNSLVEPYTLGISGGSALGIAIAIILPFSKIFGSFFIIINGFFGSLIAFFVLYYIAIKNRKLDINNLLLIGVMISFISSSILMLILAISKVENLHGIIFWMMGSLSNSENGLNYPLAIIFILGFIILYIYSNQLNAIQLGFEKSHTLGVDVEKIIKTTIIISSLITASIVSVTGMIGFVGLIVPNLMKKIFYNDFRILFITSFISGGVFLILSDFIASKIIYPNELPVGVVTGILGGIFFIYTFKKERKI